MRYFNVDKTFACYLGPPRVEARCFFYTVVDVTGSRNQLGLRYLNHLAKAQVFQSQISNQTPKVAQK